MSTPKERHYWAQLRAALTGGLWRASHPAKALNGTALPWSELLRKFNKHCQGYRDVSDMAAQTRALALLLSARYADDDEDDEIAMPGVEKGAEESKELGVDGVCVLPEERIEEALVGYEILRSHTTSNFDTIHLALAYYAFALKRPEECLAHLQKVTGLLQYQAFIPTTPDSARTSLIVPSYAPSTTSFAGSFASTSTADGMMPEVRDGRVWAMTEALRSLCIQGMSLELLHPSDPYKAIVSYRQALPLLTILQVELGLTSNASAPNAGKTPYRAAAQDLFNQTRELWRWVETLLWRAVILSAKTSDVFVITDAATQESVPAPPIESRTSSTSTVTPATSTTLNNSLWTWLSHYSACGSFWPPSFRAKHRSTVSVIHLRAFILRFGGPRSPPTPVSSGTTSRRSSMSSAAEAQKQKSWRTEALAVVKAYREVLTASTRFPRAGDRNFKVEEFVEICVALWEAGWVVKYGKGVRSKSGWENVGEDLGTSWVIDILHWSQTLTFNSSLILRHLTKLLHLSATSALSPAPYNRVLAKRTLKLYIQVVGKAWEASNEGVGEDMDTDSRWVETLVFGARMLASETARHFREGGVVEPSPTAIYPQGDSATSSLLSSYFTGHSLASVEQVHPARPHAPLEDDEAQIDDVREAARVLEKARQRLDESDTRLLAEVLLAEGVIWGLLGVISQDSLKRPSQLQNAHAALLRSIHINPTPSAYYHLALSFARRIPSTASVPPTVIHHSSTSAPEGTPTADPYVHVHSVQRALECAGLAVEGQPTDVRYWHLLGLLLSAQENWAGAREVLERGAALDFYDSDEERIAAQTQQVSSEDEEVDEDEEDEEESEDDDVESGDAFVLLGPNGTDQKGQAANGNASLPKRKRSATITANGTASVGVKPVTPAKTTVLDPTAASLPPASTILKYLHPTSPPQRSEAYALTFDQYPPAPTVLFERHLQLRMTQVTLMEVMNGPEGAEEGWLEVFAWIADKHRELRNGLDTSVVEKKNAAPAPVVADTTQPDEKIAKMRMYQGLSIAAANATAIANPGAMAASWSGTHQSLEVPIGITISPATPEVDVHEDMRLVEESLVVAQIYDEKDEGRQRGSADSQDLQSNQAHEKGKSSSLREKKSPNSGGLYPKLKRSMSSERGGDTSKSKKVQQMLKNRVHKGRAGITAVSRKIGHGVARNGGLRRSTSSPDFHAALQPTSYQASSIHSRRRLSSIIRSSDEHERSFTDARVATPIQGEWSSAPSSAIPSSTSSQRDYGTTTSQTSTVVSTGPGGSRNAREDRLMSDLWLMSAATFRRLGKIEHAKGAIQEAELRDETNPNVWVQLGLYYISLRLYQQAVDSFQKARFISPDDVPSTVHLSRLYLDPEVTAKLPHSSTKKYVTPAPSPLASSPSSASVPREKVSETSAPTSTPDTDLATGMLARLAKARGWDIPEVWYFLSKAYALQGRREMEREALKTALELSEGRGVRDIGIALGWCL
ncbi:TPR-like protein [Pholiota conissans]|uniref:TPR-like protein n=1 Tax=Pholiota conissans TaxID=109636 RepID=A0A9P6CZW8_9AGAR|nr:TPR-like protein [Pholiota conissans]